MKGQSAIEYLTTYGWMLLVIAIVGGSIFTTVQNSSQIQSTSGLANADVQVENFGVTSNGLEAEMRAASADQVENVNISLIDQGTGETVYSSERATMPVGDTETVTFSDVGSSENTNTYDIEITYDTGSLEGLTTEGTITGRLSINGTIPEENDTADTHPDLNASFTHNGSDAQVGDLIEFDASSSDTNNDIATYEWEFGDGGSSSGQTTMYRYDSKGDYSVELTVEDENSLTDVQSDTVKIEESVLNEDFEDNSINVDYATDWSDSNDITTTTASLNESYSIVTDTTTDSYIEIDEKPSAVEFLWRGDLIATDNWGDGINAIFMENSTGSVLAELEVQIDDTPASGDNVYQPWVFGNNVLSEGSTYKVKYEFNWSDNTFDFYVDGSRVLSDLDINSEWSAPMRFRFDIDSAYGNDNRMKIDDLTVYE